MFLNPPNPPRLYLVGTNTSVGKTTLGCELLRVADRRGLIFLPVKPAQSGSPDETSDIQRLCDASTLVCDPKDHCFYHYDTPLAPGVAHDPEDFLQKTPSAGVPEKLFNHFSRRLQDLESSVNPHITLIEGAGGLHVPMPAGTWQSSWIQSSRAQALIIAHSGLGTINHSLLTIEALRKLSIPIFGLFLCDHPPTDALALRTNLAIIERFGQIPVFGCLPSLSNNKPADDWVYPLFWTHIQSLLSDAKRRENPM